MPVLDDLGTEERAQHGRLITTQRMRTDDRGQPMRAPAYGVADAAPTALDRPPIVGPLSHESDVEQLRLAANRLRDDWDLSGVAPQVSGSYGQQIGSDEMNDAQARAHRRYQNAMRAIGLGVVRSVVENVVLHDLPDSRVDLLIVGLRQLVRHFGLDAKR